MSWFTKLLDRINGTGGGVKATNEKDKIPVNIFAGMEGVRFGRYSDNNKRNRKAQCWYQAETYYKEKKYNEAVASFFEYLRDDAKDNVHFYPGDKGFTFDLIQGSRQVTGAGSNGNITATARIVVMEEQNLAAMRRLLDMNYNLQYTRTAIDDDNHICMIFQTDVASASPEKLYFALRELATKADKLDDLLLADFRQLKPAGNDLTTPLTESELNLRLRYLHNWVAETLALGDAQNQDAFSGAIAYLLAGVVYRIDFLLMPEAKMLAELERISALYWDKKDEVTLVERNQMLRAAIAKLGATTKEELAKNMFHSRATFAICPPAKPDRIRDNVYTANKDAKWYMENLYPNIAVAIVEYGVLYTHFIFSMPAVLTNLTTIFMAVLHPAFFTDCGMKIVLYNADDNKFREEEIKQAVDAALEPYTDKFRKMKWDHGRVQYTSLFDFSISFSEQMANLNLETKR
ncbi:MAG: YbjN domain-containing protein [Taibaiella sp.]|nr:YbjN domain-containing protein [Taibaiella sp.]